LGGRGGRRLGDSEPANPQKNWPTIYFGRELQRSLRTLQDYARQFDDEGQRERGAETFGVWSSISRTWPKRHVPAGLTAEDEVRMEAAIEAQVKAMTDEELGSTTRIKPSD
jgi:hypothetical protein